jgi:Domain of Unknown Function (DUF1080)
MPYQPFIKNTYRVIITAIICISCAGFIQQQKPVSKKIIQQQYTMGTGMDSVPQQLKKTLPAAGKLVNDKPAGKGWVNLLDSAGNWNADQRYWSFSQGSLHGNYDGGAFHNYAWTKKNYTDFELNVLIRMEGREANSGVCIRIHPLDADNVPGYQVDMGPGYWGCLWEEKRAGMVQAFPKGLADQLVKDKDWNHYYVIAKGHHIQAWLNEVKTIDTTHIGGFEDGAIGFQLCHGDKHTVIDVKALYIKAIK